MSKSSDNPSFDQLSSADYSVFNVWVRQYLAHPAIARILTILQEAHTDLSAIADYCAAKYPDFQKDASSRQLPPVAFIDEKTVCSASYEEVGMTPPATTLQFLALAFVLGNKIEEDFPGTTVQIGFDLNIREAPTVIDTIALPLFLKISCSETDERSKTFFLHF